MKVSNQHYSVLADELIDNLNIVADGQYADYTCGRGGHSQLILDKLNDSGKLLAIDRDLDAIEFLKKKFEGNHKITLVKGNFSNIKLISEENDISGYNGIIADLGVSSPQLDNIERGFSYHGDAKLDMRMDQTQAKDAIEVINTYPIGKLIEIFNKYGECKHSKQVAFNISKKRDIAPIIKTSELVEIIKSSIPVRFLYQDKHPARTYFQAIRIEVNNEIEEIKKGIIEGINLLKKNGRMIIITFHSLEDRIIKSIFKEYTTNKIPNYIPIEEEIPFKIIKTKRVTEEEISENLRSRSAKLHIIERN
ncbi:MAG: 16S rRNA (cytosine(1402)-N(4))-methyltransferase RsmH [Mycoplasma sp.]